MLHSTVTTSGQTTIPGAVLQALNIKPGATLEYELAGDHVTVRVAGGVHALHGALASEKGKGLSFAEIRAAAAAERLRQRAE